MKKFFIKAVMLMVMPLMAASFVACDDDDNNVAPQPQPEQPDQPDQPDQPQIELSFVLEVSNVTANGADLKVTPSDLELTYVADVLPKAMFDKAGDDKVLEMLGQNVKPEDVKTGVQSFNPAALNPETEYVFFAAGFAEGKATTKLTKEAFTTLKEEVKFESELMGLYTPRFINYQLEGATEPMDYYLIIDTDWKEGVDPNTLLVGGFLPMPSVVGIMQGTVSGLVGGGLVEMELTDTGKIAAKAHELDIPADADMSTIMGMLLQPVWKPETVVFPSEATQAIYDALGYYTENGKLYLTVQKSFLTAMGQSMEQPMDIVALIENINTQFNLGFASTETYFGIPLKYTLEGNELTIMVDKSMMDPIMPLLQPILAQIPPIMGMINVDEMIEMLFNNTTDIRIKLLLEKK